MPKTKKQNVTFKWNVWMWDINHDELTSYDVVPLLLGEFNKLKKNDRPTTRDAFSEFLKREVQYYFWSKCECEMIVTGWPKSDKEEKVDMHDQLMLNWDHFVDAFWNSIAGVSNADHRKQRGRTAPGGRRRK